MATSSLSIGIRGDEDVSATKVVGFHAGISDLDNPANDVPGGRLSAADLFGTRDSAPDRLAGPAPRAAWTDRELAVQLIGTSSSDRPARYRHFELRRISGEHVTRYLLTDLRDGQVIPCDNTRAVIQAVGELS